MMNKEIIIGIDDTDNTESRGTGYLARLLGAALQQSNLAEPLSITRHQLLVHPDIPYTSHNSSASLFCRSNSEIESIADFCTDFLLQNAADGSDVGLCIADASKISDELVLWGRNAKKKVLKFEQAQDIAAKETIFLQGLTGQKTGIIGALAAVGLRKSASDGRVLWLPELRERKGVFIISELMKVTGIESVITADGENVPVNERLFTGEWMRPAFWNGKITLFVEHCKINDYEWKTASKEYIKSITE